MGSRISTVVVADQGCVHAAAVIQAVREQMTPDDELLVIENAPCGEPTDGRSPGERHLACPTVGDLEMRAWAVPQAAAELVVVLENHGIPSPTFLSTLATLFAENPALEATTFFLRNGTTGNVASRAAYAFVAGFSQVDGSAPLPRPVCSAFAIRRSAVQAAVAARGGRPLAAGDLEYDIVPRLANRGIEALPADVVLDHFQENTFSEAMSATYWNARLAGWTEHRRGSMDGVPVTLVNRYLRRVVRLNRVRRYSVPENAVLVALGSAGIAGWCVGALRGPGPAAAKGQLAHAVPAGR